MVCLSELWGWVSVGKRQGIGTDVLGTGTEHQGEVKSAEEEGPTRLPGTEPLRVADVDQVLMVRPDEDGMLGPLQPVPPLLKGCVDGQKFPVPHVIITSAGVKRRDRKATGWISWSSSER